MHRWRTATAIAFLMGLASSTSAQPPAQIPAATTLPIAFLDGVWIGPATYTAPDGQVERFEQMERVGPMMDGQVRLMEGKARDRNGKTLFNAVTVFSPAKAGGIAMRSWTMGHESPRTLTVDPAGGFTWEMKAEPGVTIRYVATVRDGIWDEYGERVGADGKATRFFEMKLKRVGSTDWPAANAAFPTTP